MKITALLLTMSLFAVPLAFSEDVSANIEAERQGKRWQIRAVARSPEDTSVEYKLLVTGGGNNSLRSSQGGTVQILAGETKILAQTRISSSKSFDVHLAVKINGRQVAEDQFHWDP